MHHCIDFGTHADGFNDICAQAFNEVAGDDDLTNKAHAQATVLGLDDHDPLALDQLTLRERLPEHDDPIHQPLTVRLTLRQGQVLLHQETLRVARLRVPSGHLGLVFAHGDYSVGWVQFLTQLAPDFNPRVSQIQMLSRRL